MAIEGGAEVFAVDDGLFALYLLVDGERGLRACGGGRLSGDFVLGEVESDGIGGVETVIKEDGIGFAIWSRRRWQSIDCGLVWLAERDADDAGGRGEDGEALEESDGLGDFWGGKWFEWVERHLGDVPFR